MSSSVKSKDARRKLRRWGFAAVLTGQDGQKFGKDMPGVFLGKYQEALALGERLKAEFLKNNPNAVTVVIEPIPYETISPKLREVFESLNAQAELITRAAFILAEKYRLSIGALDRDANALVNDAMHEAQQMHTPARVPTPIPDRPEPAEDKPERRRGIEEVNRILSEPVEDTHDEDISAAIRPAA